MAPKWLCHAISQLHPVSESLSIPARHVVSQTLLNYERLPLRHSERETPAPLPSRRIRAKAILHAAENATMNPSQVAGGCVETTLRGVAPVVVPAKREAEPQPALANTRTGNEFFKTRKMTNRFCALHDSGVVLMVAMLNRDTT